MDKYEALYNFWKSFEVTEAYREDTVPDDAKFPYITYEAVSSGFDEDVSASVNVWTRSSAWTQADTLANSIETALKDGGQILHYDDGIIWITANSSFAQDMSDPDDALIRRKLLSVQLHFL